MTPTKQEILEKEICEFLDLKFSQTGTLAIQMKAIAKEVIREWVEFHGK